MSESAILRLPSFTTATPAPRTITWTSASGRDAFYAWAEGRAEPVPESGCWLWLGSLIHGPRGGYGVVKVDGRPKKAHRVAWEIAFGPMPEGREPDHLCRVKPCIFPLHMEAVPHATNCQRAALAAVPRSVIRSFLHRKAR